MDKPQLLDELGARLTQLFGSSPAKEVEKNVKALLQATFSKLELVSREEFEVQREMLARSRDKLQQLEARVAELEAQRTSKEPPAAG